MTMDINSVGVGVTVATAILIANAGLMKLVIKSALTDLHLTVSQDFVTKTEFNRHIEGCVLNKPAKK